MGILTIPFLLLTRMATAQNYQDMTPAIQKKMAQNKNEGKDLLTDVYVHYELKFSGVKDFTTGKKLQEILAKESEAVNFFYDRDNNHVSFVCPAKYNLNHFSPVIKEAGYSIDYIYKEEYSLDKN